MSAAQAPDPQVLVVGAGPVGLTLAIELAGHGLSCRVIDQNEGPTPWSKAQLIHARTLEVLHRLGVAEEAIARGRPLHGLSLFAPGGKKIAHLPFTEIDSPYPFVLSLAQRDTEALLTARLQALGVVVERQTRLDRFRQDHDGVSATLVRGDGEPQTATTQWLVGCDGAHSTVRRQLQVPFEGSTYEQGVIQADARIDWPFPLAEDEIVTFLAPQGPLAAFPLPGEHRYRLVVVDPPEPWHEPTIGAFQRHLAERGPAGAVISEPRWMVGFGFHCRMATAYRVGRIFLAGDAAHIHSPLGGQGMNLGIQDAHNLAWKLALVARGRGRPLLLDAYEPERHPVAAAVLRGTDTATRAGLFLGRLRNPLAVELRDQLLRLGSGLGVIQERVTRTLSMLDTIYSDSPIVAQHHASLLGASIADRGQQERPQVRDWVAFGQGPAPGARALDVELGDAAGDGHLFDHLDGGRHTLLLFDGAHDTVDGYRRLGRIAAEVERAYPELVRPLLVTPRLHLPEGTRWSGPRLHDPDGAVHLRYGARSEALYLIRPDGRVAYRSQPADETPLLEYLDRIFVPAAKGAA